VHLIGVGSSVHYVCRYSDFFDYAINYIFIVDNDVDDDEAVAVVAVVVFVVAAAVATVYVVYFFCIVAAFQLF
jgi:hypothetical protein